MMLRMHSLPNAELRLEDLPATGADQTARDGFTLSFDGYRVWGERCAPMAKRTACEHAVWLFKTDR
jgi:hypothetical protein